MQNFNKLEAFLENLEVKPDIISISETWIKPSFAGPFNNLKGYHFVSNCRQNHTGGGVAFYVKHCIPFNVCTDLTIMNEKIFESLFINIRIGKENILCWTIYRAPLKDSSSNQQFLNTLKECLNAIDTRSKCYLYGDYNYDLIKISEQNFVSNFAEIMTDHSFFSIINKPTRISNNSATVLDHIWTNSYTNLIKSAVILHPLSDHLPVIMCTKIECQRSNESIYERRFTIKAKKNSLMTLKILK